MFSWLGLGKKKQEEVAPVVEDVNDNIIEEPEQEPVEVEQVTTEAVTSEDVIENNRQSSAKALAIDEPAVEKSPAEPEPEPEPELEPVAEQEPEPEKERKKQTE